MRTFQLSFQCFYFLVLMRLINWKGTGMDAIQSINLGGKLMTLNSFEALWKRLTNKGVMPDQ